MMARLLFMLHLDSLLAMTKTTSSQFMSRKRHEKSRICCGRLLWPDPAATGLKPFSRCRIGWAIFNYACLITNVNPMLFDLTNIDDATANHSMECMCKSLAEPAAGDDGIWAPHDSPFLQTLIGCTQNCKGQFHSSS